MRACRDVAGAEIWRFGGDARSDIGGPPPPFDVPIMKKRNVVLYGGWWRFDSPFAVPGPLPSSTKR